LAPAPTSQIGRQVRHKTKKLAATKINVVHLVRSAAAALYLGSQVSYVAIAPQRSGALRCYKFSNWVRQAHAISINW
jgi:hypothetical protein